MNKMTPMSRLSSQFKEFKKNTKDIFEHLVLNRASSHYNPLDYSRSKGVESDFTLIFKDKTSDISFAFVFNYLTQEEPIISANLKKGKQNKDIEGSIDFNFEQFRSRLNSINKWLQQCKDEKIFFGPVEVINKFSEVFLDQKADIAQDIKKLQEHMNSFIDEKRAELQIDDLAKTMQNTKNDFLTAKNHHDLEILQSPEYVAVQKLQAQLKIANEALEIKKKSTAKKYNMDKLKDEANKAQDRHRYVESEIDREIKQELNKRPRSYSKKIKCR